MGTPKTKTVKPRIWYDADCTCYRATAPDGYRFEDSLHELVEGCCLLGNRPSKRDKAEAKRRITERAAEYPALELCDDPSCDWCKDPVAIEAAQAAADAAISWPPGKRLGDFSRDEQRAIMRDACRKIAADFNTPESRVAMAKAIGEAEAAIDESQALRSEIAERGTV